MSTSAAQPSTPPSLRGETKSTTRNQRADFMAMAANMSWQLAFAVLVPVISGVYLDKILDSGHAFLFVGLGVALIASIVVMWRTMQVANSLPVPKLSDAERQKIKKEYEAEDDE